MNLQIYFPCTNSGRAHALILSLYLNADLEHAGESQSIFDMNEHLTEQCNIIL